MSAFFKPNKSKKHTKDNTTSSTGPSTSAAKPASKTPGNSIVRSNHGNASDAKKSSAEEQRGKARVRSCEGLIKDFHTKEKQLVLSTYSMLCPVASASKYKLGIHGKYTIVMANECNGTCGVLVKGKGKHRSCSHCERLNASKIYQTLRKRADKLIEAELVLKRREIDPMDVKKLKNIYRNGISEQYFTKEGMLLAKVSFTITVECCLSCYLLLSHLIISSSSPVKIRSITTHRSRS